MNSLAHTLALVALACVAGPTAAVAVPAAAVTGPTAAEASPAPAGATESSASTHTQSTDGTYVLNEVVVTATRRSERLMDVPLSITGRPTGM